MSLVGTISSNENESKLLVLLAADVSRYFTTVLALYQSCMLKV